MKMYPKGSEWRKWDLHVHAPGTKLSNGYGSTLDWARFCRILEESDVAVFGVADYFSVDGFINLAKQYQELYPESEKLLIPNLELRLNEAVTKSDENVNIHLLFRPGVAHETLVKFLAELKTEISDGDGRKIPCSELTGDQFAQATVTRTNIEIALANVFGKKQDRAESVIIVVPANNDGIRASAGAMRRANLADEIDKFSDAIFGNSGNTDYFLKTDRLEDDTQSAVPKPVFGGSDAHTFADLENWLGKESTKKESWKEVTWIKADPTFEGLQQTLVEPEQRVRLQTMRPDYKEPYQYISKVRFSPNDDFPAEIELNQNLVSIIGSRSSGKSALLAYIAHAVDPDHVVTQQIATRLVTKENAGPAAGKTWKDVESIKCSIEWGDPAAKVGKVIYVPQNSLYAISERPEEITTKIEPALHRLDPSFAAAHEQARADIQAHNEAIRDAVANWFDMADKLSAAEGRLRNLGDKEGIASTRNSLAEQIATLQSASALNPSEAASYQKLVNDFAISEARVKSLETEIRAIGPYLTTSNGLDPQQKVSIRIDLSPPPVSFPAGLEERIQAAVEDARMSLAVEVLDRISSYREQLVSDVRELANSTERLRNANSDLIARSKAHTELDALVQMNQKQEDALSAIALQEAALVQLANQQEACSATIADELQARKDRILALNNAFSNARTQLDDGMSFGMEHAVTAETLAALSRAFNMRDIGDYVDRDSQCVNIEYAQDDPKQFLQQMHLGTQKLKRGEEPANVASKVLTATPETRLYATLDGDRIGGFQISSMTPGKQALFALRLILDESPEAWPLLIDQPEDDLDSRSVYEHIVPYLARRKIERQIIMVSHNANLVVGADSEQIIVANRHGDDRRNEFDRTFSYMTGSLEHSQPKNPAELILHSCGIREHACEILDGGEEAFRKRGSKYKM